MMKRTIILLIVVVGLVLLVGCSTSPPAPLLEQVEGGKVTETRVVSETPIVTLTASPNNTAWPTATVKSTETSTPTIPATPFYQAHEAVYDSVGLYWLECEVSWDVYHDWRIAEDCFGDHLPSSQNEDGERSAERFQRKPGDFYDFRLVIENDVYETRNQRPPLVYTLYKNGEVFAQATTYFTTYNPSRALINVDGKVAWELADPGHPTIIFDGHDLRQSYNLDAAYYPYSIIGKLVFVAKMDDKYFVYFNGEQIGPVFDEISIGYCCSPAAYSIQRVQGQYRFWGSREGKFYLVTVQAMDGK